MEKEIYNYDELLKKFSRNLKKERKRLGLRQKDLAEKIGVTVKTIQNYEKGLTLPSLKLMEKIALVFDVSLEKFTNEYFFSEKETTVDVVERVKLDLNFNQKVNNLILTDIIFDIVDLEFRYKNGILDEKVLNNSIGCKNDISCDKKYNLVRFMLEMKLNNIIYDLKNEMFKNYSDIVEVYRLKDNKGCIINKERYK